MSRLTRDRVDLSPSIKIMKRLEEYANSIDDEDIKKTIYSAVRRLDLAEGRLIIAEDRRDEEERKAKAKVNAVIREYRKRSSYVGISIGLIAAFWFFSFFISMSYFIITSDRSFSALAFASFVVLISTVLTAPFVHRKIELEAFEEWLEDK